MPSRGFLISDLSAQKGRSFGKHIETESISRRKSWAIRNIHIVIRMKFAGTMVRSALVEHAYDYGSFCLCVLSLRPLHTCLCSCLPACQPASLPACLPHSHFALAWVNLTQLACLGSALAAGRTANSNRNRALLLAVWHPGAVSRRV